MWNVDGLGVMASVTDVEMLPWAQALYNERLETYGHAIQRPTVCPRGRARASHGLDPLRIVQTPNLT